jgi:hypothetical protein
VPFTVSKMAKTQLIDAGTFVLHPWFSYVQWLFQHTLFLWNWWSHKSWMSARCVTYRHLIWYGNVDTIELDVYQPSSLIPRLCPFRAIIPRMTFDLPERKAEGQPGMCSHCRMYGGIDMR